MAAVRSGLTVRAMGDRESQMCHIAWKSGILAVLLATGPALADEQGEKTAASEDGKVAYKPYSLDELLDYRYVLSNAAANPSPSEPATVFDTASMFGNIDFDMSSDIVRLSRIRSLSLLTLAEFDTGRLFFGINSDGYLGFHMGAATAPGNPAHLELAQLPFFGEREQNEDDDNQ